NEIDELILLRDTSRLLVAEAYMILHHPQWHQAKQLFESGVIGKVVLVNSVFTYNNREDKGNIRNRTETGGGGIRDIGVYNYGCTRYVTGEEPLNILSVDIHEENGVDVYAHVVTEFPSFRCSTTNSMRMALRQEVIFHGENGIMRLSAPFNPGVYGEARIDLIKPGHETSSWRYPELNQYILQVESFNNNISTPKNYPCSLEFVRGTQVMIDMIFATQHKE
ncbi:MAG: Gfo/Idh/MocA family oxidoreductase, partial [Gammaproteobacteria bacterium]|nr:Gfo/Idh/MocA family oxidoreductase [Gammaproteobacteria bacterium]